MPHHEITSPLCSVGAIIGRGGWKPWRAILQRTSELCVITHANRTAITRATLVAST